MHVRKAQHTDGVISASRVAPTPQRGVAGFNRNQWQLSIGMGGNLQLESVAGFDRNQWQSSTGIRMLIDLVEQGGDKIEGDHRLLRSWQGVTLSTSVEEVHDHDNTTSKD
jgi:hypothetical protein